MFTLEELRKYFGDDTMTEEQIKERFKQEKDKHNSEVQKIVDGYNGLDMDLFVKRIGGQEKIDEMKRINKVTDRLHVVNGTVVQKSDENKKTDEDLVEWKRGFMEGFEEAYKRLMNK